MENLTPLELQALQLYVKGITSHSQLGKKLGKSRQQAQQLTAALRRKVLTTQASVYASTREAYPADNSDDPFPRMARRAVHGEFVLRANTQLREDGRDAPANECSIIWTYTPMPREWGWTWTTNRTQVWTTTHTRAAYVNWRNWITRETYLDNDVPSQKLPELTDAGPHSITELTATLAWVIGTEALIYEDVLPLPA